MRNNVVPHNAPVGIERRWMRGVCIGQFTTKDSGLTVVKSSKHASAFGHDSSANTFSFKFSDVINGYLTPQVQCSTG